MASKGNSIDDVAVAALQKFGRKEREAHLADLLHRAMGATRPWSRATWMAEEDAGVCELARRLIDLGVTVQPCGQEPQAKEE